MIKIVNTQLRDYDGKKIIVGEIDGVSQELSNFITEVKAYYRKSLLFADKDQVPNLRTMICAVADYPQGIVVYFKKDYPNQYYIEHGIAHELMHMHLKYCNSIPQLNIPYPEPLKMNISVIVSIIQDFLVDKELDKRGFDTSQFFKKDVKDTLGRLTGQKSTDNFIREVGIYVQFFAFQPKFLQKASSIEKQKRNYIKLQKIYKEKLPEVVENGNRIIDIIRKHDIYTEAGYKQCVQEVIDFLRPNLGIDKVNFS